MEGEFVTIISFGLGEQTFAFDSLKVRNILPYEGNLTKVPNTREFILGVINLHGNIVPVTDMRKIMDMEDAERTKDTSIIIVSPEDKLESQFGIMVDMVKEVFEVPLDQIKPAVFENKMGLIECFEGTVKVKDEFVHLIDLTHVVSQIERKN
ncbi:chemotaxis protein CheW [Saccharicrinis fermentans]|uniref:Chemotaxis protein CheW n=1 Tax=Saccharicrinis fermentans DSM 9555 = JCM 21142 TaxID=869213 RepID=W7XUW3_9BACT|nr:chemotaxis protein CheW [Saccharicrinis fermentans]GAF01830.1 chemotaxis protein CheW [Saccharicrinis fermentans DSM 9555 = JCM 21142]